MLSTYWETPDELMNRQHHSYMQLSTGSWYRKGSCKQHWASGTDCKTVINSQTNCIKNWIQTFKKLFWMGTNPSGWAAKPNSIHVKYCTHTHKQTNKHTHTHTHITNSPSVSLYLSKHISELQVVLKEPSWVHQPLVFGQLRHKHKYMVRQSYYQRRDI